MHVCVRVAILQPGLIVSSRWPVTPPVDEVVIKSSTYLMEVVHDLRKRLKAASEPRKVSHCAIVTVLHYVRVIYSGLVYSITIHSV